YRRGIGSRRWRCRDWVRQLRSCRFIGLRSFAAFAPLLALGPFAPLAPFARLFADVRLGGGVGSRSLGLVAIGIGIGARLCVGPAGWTWATAATRWSAAFS